MKVRMGSIRPIARLIGKRVWDEGVWALGDDYYRFSNVTESALDDMDCYFQFNMFNPYRENKIERIAAYRYIMASQKPFLVWEEGNFRQYPQYKKIGWWSYQRSGRFNNGIVDTDRWQRIVSNTSIDIKPWASPGDEIVIMGQLNFDSALMSLYDAGYYTFSEWVEHTIAEIRKYTDRRVCIRPHPLDKKSYARSETRLNKQYKNVYVSKNFAGKTAVSGGAGLAEDLAKSWAVVTYTSNSAVEAVCAGVPVFAQHPDSVVWDIAHHNIADIENLNYNIEVYSWCHQVAYTMWTSEEIRKGETWAHLKPVYFS
jgi:hypothetical protein